MEFLITNREKITYLKLEMPYIVISVREPEKDFPKLREDSNRLGLLQLTFTDLDTKESAKQIGQEHLLIAEDQAKGILAFVSKYFQVIQTIVCQCDAGISRSSGIAAALSKIMNGNDSWIFNSMKYVPNMFVYRMILNKYYNA